MVDYEESSLMPAIRTLILLCACFLIVFTADVHAQCSTREALQNGYFVPAEQSVVVQSPVTARVWATVRLGAFPTTIRLRHALDAASCAISDTAQRIMASTEFTVSTEQTDVDLVALSSSELGFRQRTASLNEIYSRALDLGFGLAPAEIGPLLRLQYTWQPFGEFDNIAMNPIGDQGTPAIFVVANGGAGLVLFGQEAAPNMEFLPPSRFVFTRTRKVGPAAKLQ
jgi:hypothetical protein